MGQVGPRNIVQAQKHEHGDGDGAKTRTRRVKEKTGGMGVWERQGKGR